MVGYNLKPEYEAAWDEFIKDVKNISMQDAASKFNTLYYIMQKYTWAVPSATPWKRGISGKETVPDISLFDHSKTTCAIAECLYEGNINETYLDNVVEGIKKHFAKKSLSENERDALEKEVFVLIGGDISGIQKFIYSITSKGAAKGLKGRSIYLQLLSRAISKYIVNKLGLSITNILYSAGGRFYILTPSDKNREEIYETIERTLLEIHRGELYLSVAEIPIRAIDFLDGNFAKKWDELGEKLAEKKKKKFSRILDKNIFQPYSEYNEICHVCGQPSDKIIEEDGGVKKCRLCKSFEELAGKIAGKNEIKARYLVEGEPSGKEEEGTWMWNISRFGITYDMVEKLDGKKYSLVCKLNDTNFIDPTSENHTSLGFSFVFQTPLMELKEMAERSEGIKRWGVLRGDVDNLGKIFREGLKDNATISRISTLSSMLSLFFNGYMNVICKKYKGKVYGIYSGGDDFFIVASWSILPELAQKIYEEFRRFTCYNPNITLSMGISIAPSEKYPIYRIAELSGDALELSKSSLNGTEKNSITFMGFPVKWDVFNGPLQEFKEELERFIEGKPKGILHKFYAIYKMYEKKKMEVGEDGAKYDMRYARWRWILAYFIARVKAKNEEKEKMKKLFVENIDSAPIVIRWVEYLKRGEKNE